jgi:hypothetical protein
MRIGARHSLNKNVSQFHTGPKLWNRLFEQIQSRLEAIWGHKIEMGQYVP